MRRSRSVSTTTRESALPVDPALAWSVVASGEPGPQWYVDAAPFVVRGAIDRLVGGAGRRWPPPGRPLRTGDRAGFWSVTLADQASMRLDLAAQVRAPGEVTLATTIAADDAGCRLRQTVTLCPAGLLGAAYLVVDLGAREAVAELTHRRLVADILAAT